MHDLFFNAVAGFFLASYGLSNMAVGFLANERSFVGSLLGPAIGGLSDRTRTPLGPRRPYLILLIPPAVICLLILALRPPVWLAVLLFVLEPLFLSLAVVPYQALLPDRVASEQRASVNGVNVLLGMAGGMVLLVAARFWWADHPALVFALVAVALALGCLITVLTVHESTEAPAADAAPSQGPVAYVRELLGHRAAARYVASYFFFWVGIGGITPFVTRFGHEELGIPESDTFVLLLAVLLATLAFSAPSGWLGDRYGKKRVTSWGLVLFAVFILLGSQTTSAAQAVPLLMLAGLAQAVPSVLGYPLFTDLVPARRMGEMTGLSTMIWSLAQPVGATLFGALADQTGTLRTVLVGGGITLLVAWLILQMVQVPIADAERGTLAADEPAPRGQ